MNVYSSTVICNLALDMVRVATITSLNEVGLAAGVCRRNYPHALAAHLERHDWGFARKREVMSELATNERPAEWGHAYAQPGDLALPIRLVVAGTATPVWDGPTHGLATLDPDVSPFPFDYARGVLWTGLKGAALEYVGNNPEVGELPAMFVDALATNLASRLAMPIKGDAALAKSLADGAEVLYQRAAQQNDARKPHTYGDFIPETIAAKLSC